MIHHLLNLSSSVKLVILDNIELITPSTSPIIFISILKFIDKLELHDCCCLAFSSSGIKVDPSWTEPFRLGKPHRLPDTEAYLKDLTQPLSQSKRALETFTNYMPFKRVIQEVLPLFRSNQHQLLRPTGMLWDGHDFF